MGNEMRTEVCRHYAKAAKAGQGGDAAASCCGINSSCCGGSNVSLESERIGYSTEQLALIQPKRT
jgi:hypothetical protein